MASGSGGAECVCPHHEAQQLRLMGETERVVAGKVTTITKYRCPVQGCGYTYVKAETVEE